MRSAGFTLRAVLAAGLLSAPAIAQLQNGQVINLKCLAAGGTSVWLAGDPAAGSVKLRATTAEDPGTAWKVAIVGGNTINLQCMGSGAKPWLDGDTGLATVQLRDTATGFPSASWQVQANGDGTISLASLGGTQAYIWLDGETTQGKVGLRENTFNYAGTRWLVQTAAAAAPGCFHLSSPTDTSTVTNPPTLAWEASTDATSYSLRVYDTSCANGDALYARDGLTTTSLKVPAGTLQNGKTYAWLVYATNTAGNTYSNACSLSPGGACWTFTTITPTAGCFALTSPPRGARVGPTPTLEWQSSAHADGYDVVIYETSCGSGSPVHEAPGLGATTYAVPAGVLRSGRTYSWLVRAVNAAGATTSNTCSGSLSGACFTLGVDVSTVKEYPVPAPGSRPQFLAAGPDGALWFTEVSANAIGRISTAGTVTEFPLPTAGSWPFAIAAGPDGNLWFTEYAGNRIGRITPTGAIAEFDIPTRDSQPSAITAGADGNLWFTELAGNRIGRISPVGTVTEFAVPTAGSGPFGIAAGPDGNLWFTESVGNGLGSITTAGVVTEFPLPTPDARPRGIVAGPDGNLWFTEYSAGKVAKATPAGAITEFAIPTAGSWPFGIASGPDGALWFTEYAGNRVGSITTAGVVTEFTIPTPGSGPVGIASGPDGRIWFTEQQGNQIGQVLLEAPVSALTVPIVLSGAGLGGSFFTSELALTNRGGSDAALSLSYTPAFGGGSSGNASDTVPARTQKIVPDAIAYLKSLGIDTGDAATRGGTLRIESSWTGAATVRTTTPVPGGRVGLAYPGLPPSRLLSAPVVVCGLRQNATDRSNVAVLNAGSASDGPVTLRLTVTSGDPGDPRSQALPDVVLAPGAFQQLSGVLGSNGLALTNGTVRVERVSGTAPFYAYGVINDQASSDGSFVQPVPAAPASAISRLTLPVLLETATYATELVLTNLGSASRTLHATWVAPALTGGQVSFDVSLLAGEQQILPAFVQALRSRGVVTDPAGRDLVGALFIADAAGGDLRGVSVAARSTTPGGGGRYGTFYAAVPAGAEATGTAWLHDLQKNADTRTNLALVNVGSADAASDTFRIDIRDGATGRLAGTIAHVDVPAKGFVQIGAVLAQYAPSTSNAYALVTRTSGSNPFIAYAVVNDGARPGEGTGDGAFIEAEVAAGP